MKSVQNGKSISKLILSKEVISILHEIFDLPASISVITGKWKTGKTDFGLLILELLLKLGIIRQASSNVNTSGKLRIPFINDIMTLEKWMFRRNVGGISGVLGKAYLYDEAISSTPSRRAMSRLNTAWLRFVPQLSKGKGHLIVIAQESDYMESTFLHPTFIRAYFHKIAFPKRHPQFRKVVRVYIPNAQQNRVFLDLPPTSFKFDPYRQASFYIEPQLSEIRLEDNVKLAFEYADGLSSTDLINKYDYLHSRKEVMRRVRLGIKALKSSYLVHDKVVG